MKYVATSFIRKSLPIIKEAAYEARQKLVDSGKRFSCKPKCSSCCVRPVRITLAEAAAIVDSLKSKNLWEKVKKIAIEYEEFDEIDQLTWLRMKISCPVLDTDSNLCMAYENRPLTCSIHYVDSDPKGCDPWNAGPARYSAINMDELYVKYANQLITQNGNSVWIVELALYKALLISEQLREKDGLDPDRIMQLIAGEKI